MSTTTITQLLENLSQRGIRLWVEGEQLRFKAPQGALTAELKASLQAQKPALLEILRAPSLVPAPIGDSIQLRSAPGDAPLSFSQERLWLINQFAPGAAGNSFSDAIRIEGCVSVFALQQTLQQIIRRHEILRTVFITRGARLWQSILCDVALSFQIVDLDSFTANQKKTEFDRLLQQELDHPLDAGNGPLLRVCLFRLTLEEHILLLTLHPMIYDRWSADVLLSELREIYRSYSSGIASSLPLLSVQYADFARWQRERMKDSRLETELSFWKQNLAGTPEGLQLPLDRPRTRAKNLRVSSHVFRLSFELLRAAVGLCRQEDVTLSVLLLSAWDLLLCRYSGQHDLVIGTLVAGRIRPELEPLIGLFANTLALRFQTSGGCLFSEHMQHVREVVLAAKSHQELPFEKVVEELQPQRDPGSPPIFEVMFAMQDASGATINSPDTAFVRTQLQGETVGFDLSLNLQESDRGLDAELDYDAELFDPSTIERMSRHFASLLASAVHDPQLPISELEMLSEAESRQLLMEWNQTEVSREARNVVELFEEQVRLTPEAVAVEDGKEELSYQDLNRRANQMGRYLRNLGVGPEIVVGICMERSVEMVVALLGVLKAGAAYVPLDPAYPPERLRSMVEDCFASILLTHRDALNVASDMGDILGCLWICWEDEWEQIGREEQENLQGWVDEDNLAYVMYTSGSTGKPKGVMITYGGLANYLEWSRQAYQTRGIKGAPVHSSIGFDLTVTSLYGALLGGGRAMMVSGGAGADRLRQKLEEFSGRTLVKLTPAHLEVLGEKGSKEGWKEKVGVMVVGGEALRYEQLAALRKQMEKGARVINEYGPTETVVGCCVYEIKSSDSESGSVPIGRPVSNTQMYILDAEMEPVPVGVVGEIYIGGKGVGRGYRGEGGMTAERFVPNRWAVEGGERLYRTGDLGRYRADGIIEYFGRTDQQVKIRGYRIELGEIEAALVGCASVKEVVVILREDQPGEKRLVGYVVLEKSGDGKKQLQEELRNELKKKLPDYMVPVAFVEMEKLPLTTNAKLDRKALPKPQLGKGKSKYVAPRNRAEEVLCEIWARVLEVERVGVDDNFFELGGDSILSVQIVSQAEEEGLNFSLRHIFEHQTIAELVKEIAVNPEQEPEAPEVAAFGLISQEERLSLPQDVEDAYPLSRLQAGMFFHSQYNPDAILYHNVSNYQLQMPLDLEMLMQAVEELVQQHPVLRTSFHFDAYSQPLQLVHRTARIHVQMTDVSHLSEEEQEEEIRRWREEEKKRFFDPEIPGLVRFHVHLRAQDRFEFGMTEHHVILDGWSVASLLTELFTCYLAKLEGRPWQPEPLVTTFRNFVALEQTELRSLEARSYWEEQLQDVSAPQMPWSGRMAGTQGRGHVRVAVGEDLSANLKSLAQQLGVSLKTLLLAGHMRVMHMLSSTEEDVITGLVFNGRPETPDGERVLGLFLNTLPLRIRLRGGRWTDLVEQTAAATASLLRHRRYPLPELQVLSGKSSLFDVIFNFTHFHVYRQLQQSGLKLLSSVEFERTNFALVVDAGLNALSSEVHLILDYDRALIEAGQVETIAGYYRNTLRALVKAPDELYEAARLLTDEEERQLLLEWNQTKTEYPEKCVQELFEEQTARTPNAVAVVYEGQELSYAELNLRANQLAHYLRNLGVGPEVLVGICIQRSLDMIVGILGILKAGGGYLPLDPQYPAERLSYMIEDAGMQVLLLEKELDASLPRMAVIEVYPQEVWESATAESGHNPDCRTWPDNLAYVMYTSGSTGKPKGIAVPHRGVVRLVKENNFAGFGREEVVLQMAPISFDASTLELWACLLNGGKLAVMKAGVPSLDEVGGVLRDHGVTTAWLTAGLFHAMVEEQMEALQGVRQVLAGGDVLSPPHVQRFLEGNSGRRTLINGYGPTENTTFTCCHGMAEYNADGGTVPIGCPIANTRVYVLDEWMRPAPVGIIGELYIGGDGLARGYVGQADLTAETFAPNPVSTIGGERLYQSGDLCRWRETGRLEFVGRKDQQVKIRGYRIELAEIEGVLGEYPEVGQAVVVSQEAPGAGKRLLAYVVGRNGKTISESDLASYLRDRLPEYMVPAVFVNLQELPLTSNGKVDRKGLPAPEQQFDKKKYLGPRNLTEEMLCAIWSGVLGVKQVGIEDNFFELGGHSLLATQLVSRLRKVCAVDVPLHVLFENPTVAELSEKIAQQKRSGLQDGLGIVKRVNRAETLPLSFGQQRLWFIDQLEPGSAAYNMPIGVRLSGELNKEALRWAAQEIVRRHEVLRTRFPQRDGFGVQEIDAEMEVAVEEIDLEHAAGGMEKEAAARKRATLEAQQSFDLARGPLVRLKLLRLAERDHVLLLIMHHIVGDGWSMGIMVREFSQLYVAHCNGVEPQLPELPIQYADFSVWQRQWLQGALLDKQLRYWKERLLGVQALELPTDRPRPAVLGSGAGTVEFHLEPQQVERLKNFSQRQGTTLFMTLLAAQKVLLHRYSGQEDISVGSPIAGRRQKETEGLIGFFVNTLVLRTAIRSQMSFIELLRQVRENTLEAYTCQDVPFEKVVEELQPERDLSRTPLFQMMFILHNTPRFELELGGVTARLWNVDSETTNFDLSWDLRENQGLDGWLTYHRDLFDRETAERMINHYLVLLDAIVDRLQEPIATLPMLVNGECEQLLLEWNRAEVEYPESCVHELFENQVARTPRALALEHKGAGISYEELNRQANQLGHCLQQLGVKPEVRVGICLERGLEMVVAILGVLKAGGAYVPLDPAYPKERLEFILEDSQAALLVTQRHLHEHFSGIQRGLIFLEDIRTKVEQCSEQRVESGVSPDNLAYVIYTSGSTGRPKGVAVTHRSTNVLLQWSRAVFGQEELEGVLGSTSICFDVSVFELFAPLSWGGTLLLVENALSLAESKDQQRVRLACMVPSAIAELLQMNAVPSSVRTLNLAGEALPPSLVKQIYEQTGIERVLNIYGPSEDTTYSTYALMQRGEESRAPIGRPLSNTQVYVLDLHGWYQVVGTGMAGELYLGGAGLARGYLSRPELTAERFVPNPFSKIGGARLYRTGDRVQWNRDGQLEFLGRLDHQVKIRGFRIELGEIEAVLLRQDNVSEAAVIAREDKPGDRQLVAYVVLEGVAATNGGSSVETLKARLKMELPAYMVPSAFVLLAKMPLLPNGKVDRKSLPVQERDLLPRQAYVGPRDALELQLVQIWEELLAVQPIGIRDNFFELGGHSLKAVQAVARMKQQFGGNVAVAALLQHPTIEELATALRGQLHSQERQALVRIRTGKNRKPFFCVHPVGGNVLCYAGLARHLSPEQPFYALQSLDHLAGIEAMAAHYAACLQSVQPHGPYLLGGWSMGGVVAFEMARQLRRSGNSTELFLIDSVAPSVHVNHQLPNDQELFGYFVRDIEGIMGRGLNLPVEALALEPLQRVHAIAELVRKEGMVPPEVESDDLVALFETFRSNLNALLNYQLSPYEGPVTLIRSSATSLDQNDPALGWSRFAADLEIHEIEGDHYSIVTGAQVVKLAALLEQKLAGSSSRHLPMEQQNVAL